MIDLWVHADPFLSALIDPCSGSTLPGDPGLGEGQRWIRLGTVTVPETDTFLVAEPIPDDRGGLAGREVVRVPGCAAGNWDLWALRCWGDRWSHTATAEYRAVLAGEPAPTDEWPYWEDDTATGIANGPAGVQHAPGYVDCDGGTVVGVFEQAALGVGSGSGLTGLTGFLDGPNGDFSPRLLPGAGWFQAGEEIGGYVKFRRDDQDRVVEIGVGYRGLTPTEVEKRLAGQRAERAAFDAHVTRTDSEGGYELAAGECRECQRPVSFRLPLAALVRLPELRHLSLILPGVPREDFLHVQMGVHRECLDLRRAG